LGQQAVGPPVKAAPGISASVFAAQLRGPRGLLVDRGGDIWVAEEAGGAIARINLAGKVSRVAGGLVGPHDLDIDSNGNLYVAETATGRVLIIRPGRQPEAYGYAEKGPPRRGLNR
jgi:streptogramin lyase